MRTQVISLAAALNSLTASAANTYIDVSSPRQTIVSFGASGAWWPNDLYQFPADVQQSLAAFLFSEDGIHLSSYRYNMGGDGGSDAMNVTVPDRRVQSFLLRNGTYDFSRDAAGVSFMRAANEYDVPEIAFFINAAPSHIASNGAACGWTMTAGSVDEFAGYISTVLTHFINDGINIRWISPMNEPINSRSNCGQEGMAVPPLIRPLVFNAVHGALPSTVASNVQIMGDETSWVSEALLEDNLWLPLSFENLNGIAIHNYDFPINSEITLWYNSLQTLTAGKAPPVKFTETCCSTNSGYGPLIFGTQFDPTIVNALDIARYVWQFMTLAQAESFDWWTAVSHLPCSPSVDGMQCATAVNNTAGSNDCLVAIDGNFQQTGDYNLYYTKRAFMMKHWATFHRPGSVRYDVDNVPDNVMAFATKNSTGAYHVLFINPQTDPSTVAFQLPAVTSVNQVIQTTNTTDWGVVNAPSPDGQGNLNITLPPQSLLTLQLV